MNSCIKTCGIDKSKHKHNKQRKRSFGVKFLFDVCDLMCDSPWESLIVLKILLVLRIQVKDWEIKCNCSWTRRSEKTACPVITAAFISVIIPKKNGTLVNHCLCQGREKARSLRRCYCGLIPEVLTWIF